MLIFRRDRFWPHETRHSSNIYAIGGFPGVRVLRTRVRRSRYLEQQLIGVYFDTRRTDEERNRYFAVPTMAKNPFRPKRPDCFKRVFIGTFFPTIFSIFHRRFTGRSLWRFFFGILTIRDVSPRTLRTTLTFRVRRKTAAVKTPKRRPLYGWCSPPPVRRRPQN